MFQYLHLVQGYWVVLDELNLAPSEVLEALNRLLDDNHELFIPETQEIVRPHPHFMLFATQNPPGIYGTHHSEGAKDMIIINTLTSLCLFEYTSERLTCGQVGARCSLVHSVIGLWNCTWTTSLMTS